MSTFHWDRVARTSGDARYTERLGLGVRDIANGLRLWRLWVMLGWSDIRNRYRRSLIGPFWLTISMGIMVLGLSVVYGTIFAQSLENYLPYVACSFLAWFFISTVITDGANTFVQAEGLIKHGGLPLSIYIYRMIWRNLLIFGHNAIIVVIVFAVYQKTHFGSMAMSLLGLALVVANLTWVVMIIAPLCTRYRDLSPIVASFMQFMFFMTPITFRPSSVGEIAWVYQYNPLHYLVDAVRSPLVGDGLDQGVFIILFVSACIGLAIASAFYASVRSRIAYWL